MHRRKASEVYLKLSAFETCTWTNLVGVECFTAIHSVLTPTETGYLLATKSLESSAKAQAEQ